MWTHATNRTHSALIHACRRLVETAETFADRAPRQKGIELERLALFDALFHAQLVLSLAQLSPEQNNRQRKARGQEDQLNQSQAQSEQSQSKHE